MATPLCALLGSGGGGTESSHPLAPWLVLLAPSPHPKVLPKVTSWTLTNDTFIMPHTLEIPRV